MPLSTLDTPRLTLRPLRAADAPRFLALAGDWDVARMTSDIPHPLLASHARHWLTLAKGDVRFAIELHGKMIGSVGYFRRSSGLAELGFWLGREHWGAGYATEAATAVVQHGFGVGGHRCFSSAHFADNPASGRVLAKLGFEATGHGRMWCSARGLEVDAVALELTRYRAELLLGPLPEPRRMSQPAWSGFLGRWLAAARGQ